MKDFPKLISSALLSVAFTSTFIGIFFFTYAKGIEKQIVINNLTYTINGLVDGALTFIKGTEYGSLINLNNLPSGDNASDEEADAKVAESNNQLMIKVAFV